MEQDTVVTASHSELDQKLSNLLQVMASRLPEGKSISSAVVQQLLLTKYAKTFPESYVADKAHAIDEILMKLLKAKKQGSAAGADAPALPESNGKSIGEIDNSGGEDVAESESENDDDEDEDEDEDEQETGSDYEEDNDDDDDDGDDDDHDSNDASEEGGSSSEPQLTRTRTEAEDGLKINLNGKEKQLGDGDVALARRCKEMANCLRKLGYHVRSRGESESLNSHLYDYLIPEFKSQNLDPDKYDKKAIEIYKIRKEVEFLQKDGATLNLDRRSRVGRAYGNAEPTTKTSSPAKQIVYTAVNLLDDE